MTPPVRAAVGRQGAGRYGERAMGRRVLLWDIDGTLVHAGPAGAAVFDSALVDVLGSAPTDRVAMSGKTDPLIVREHLALLGLDPSPETIQEVCDRLAVRLAEAEGEIATSGSPCPGVPELLDTLRRRDDVVSGLLTGNLEANARVKLRAFGLDRFVDVGLGAFGSDDEDRNALVPIALRRVTDRLGVEPDPGDVWVIGDTPRDLDCARSGGVRCLLVATGAFDAPTLADLGADAVVEDLSDTDAVLELLLG
jgi:phosphoglycolate phosphatase